ncbi:sulfotransferase [Roseovarius sp. MMSF_3281]|uniref:sulfotransferase n=1 Tax=Roseovarius sp. MMSF_3281 TaxID=3046694 RepID=UPI00273EDF58|nr:sulfotransferase [Roseovarius sp. MMSF_3281]
MDSPYENSDFVRSKLNSGEHRDVIGGLWDEVGKWQFNLLKKAGLKPRHRLVDVGCGSLRGGVHFIPYLERGNYFGTDINGSLVEAGLNNELSPDDRNRVPSENFCVSDDFSFNFEDVNFDYAIAVSLFTHLSRNKIEMCLSQLRPKMNASHGRFLATFFLPKEGAPTFGRHPQKSGIHTFSWHDPFHYTVQTIEDMASNTGWKVESVEDLGHPRGQIVVMFSVNQKVGEGMMKPEIDPSGTRRRFDKLFLSVGSMKAGTTWLHQQLAGHPEIYFSPEKEIHYFADPHAKSYMSLEGRISRYQRVVGNLKAERMNPHVQRNLAWYATRYLAPVVDDDWYYSLFDDRPPQKKNASYPADFSNLYAVMDDADWSRVLGLADDVRVIYTMRHPGKRLWSNFKFSYEFSGQGHVLESLSEADYAAFFDDPGTKSHADYASIIESLHRNLSDAAVQLLFFENMRQEPLQTLRLIESFLEIPEHSYREQALQRKVNPSSAIEVPAYFAERADEICVNQIAQLQKLGVSVPEDWHKPLSSALGN